MPPRTCLTERLLSARMGRPVRRGDVVTVPVSRIMAHDGTSPVIARALDQHGFTALAGADRTVFVFDHYYPPVTEREAQLQAYAREFAARHGIPVLAGAGISHQVLPERGLMAPGTVMVGADSHTCSGGAFGVLSIGLGATDVAAVLVSGRLWLQVPQVLTVRLEGRLPPGVGGQDLVLTIVGRVGMSGALERVIEFVGPGVASLSMEDRFKLANHGVEMGALSALVGVDAQTLDWLGRRGADLAHAADAAADAGHDEPELEVDLSRVERVVAHSPRPDLVRPLAGMAPARVDQVFIGSCAGGRLSDWREAAAILGGRQVHPRVRLLLGPASQQVLSEAMADGTLQTLLDAGATLLPPGCGACMGRLGTLAPGEVEVATQNRNFLGRAGSTQAQIILGSATTAAYAALNGALEEACE